MLSEEVTIGIYPDGELYEILIVPDGHEYHLFSIDTSKFSSVTNTSNIGSIVIVNHGWIYEGDKLTHQSQKEIADYILCYPDASNDYPITTF